MLCGKDVYKNTTMRVLRWLSEMPRPGGILRVPLG